MKAASRKCSKLLVCVCVHVYVYYVSRDEKKPVAMIFFVAAIFF
jgi:hypothetical protein